jgi:hypothetical protein
LYDTCRNREKDKMTTTSVSQPDWTTFDMTKLPIAWDEIPQEKIQSAFESIEASADLQVEQVEAARNNIAAEVYRANEQSVTDRTVSQR